MSTPGYLSNAELASRLSTAVSRWNTNANQMTALISQPSGTVIVTDGLGHHHELPSFPQLQLTVTAMTDELTGAVAQVADISSTVTGLATAAEASASSAQAAAASVEGVTIDVEAAVTAAGEATTAMQAAQASATDAAASAGNASTAASSAASSANTAAAAHTGAEAARDAAQGYADQAYDIVTSAGNVVSVAGRTGTVVLSADDIASGTFAVERIPTLPISNITGLHTLSAPKRTQRFFFNQL